MSRSSARIALRNAVIELKGKKTSQQVADHFGITRGAVKGIWWRSNPVNRLDEANRSRRIRQKRKAERVIEQMSGSKIVL